MMHGEYEVYGSLPSRRYTWEQLCILGGYPVEGLLDGLIPKPCQDAGSCI